MLRTLTSLLSQRERKKTRGADANNSGNPLLFASETAIHFAVFNVEDEEHRWGLPTNIAPERRSH
jgi:hypothetical protein